MSSGNVTILLGNLTRDPETKAVGEHTVCKFGIAHNHKFRDRDGRDAEDVCFIECEAWNKPGEIVQRYAAKGKQVFISGRLRYDRWEDQSGGKHSRHVIVVENVQLLGGKDQQASSEQFGGYDRPQPQSRYRERGPTTPDAAGAQERYRNSRQGGFPPRRDDNAPPRGNRPPAPRNAPNRNVTDGYGSGDFNPEDNLPDDGMGPLERRFNE